MDASLPTFCPGFCLSLVGWCGLEGVDFLAILKLSKLLASFKLFLAKGDSFLFSRGPSRCLLTSMFSLLTLVRLAHFSA